VRSPEGLGGDAAVKIDAADNLILFLHKIIKQSDDTIDRFYPVVCSAMNCISTQPEEIFRLFVRSFFSLRRLAVELSQLYGNDSVRDFAPINKLLVRCLQMTHTYWLYEADPLKKFLHRAELTEASEQLESIFHPIAHHRLRAQKDRLQHISAGGDASGLSMLQRLLELDDHHAIAQAYREIPRQLFDAGGKSDIGNQWKIIFLFQAMNITGLAIHHEDTLRDINRTLNWLIANQKPRYVHTLIQKTFSILKASASRFPTTSIACVDNMGREIFLTGNRELIDYFTDTVIELGFQTPMIAGVGNDWQIRVNPAHIQNIRTWMKLIQLQPKESIRLISNLIIHLAVSGVFIKDTDLFGRDITHFLNGDIGPVYNLAKQLARLFPVYFNDIGAEGELRDISTRIDEICHRRDPLVHFLRKQSHVESSNRIIGFMDAILDFWATRDKSQLASYMPPNIFRRISTNGPYIDGIHIVTSSLQENGAALPTALLAMPAEEIEAAVGNMTSVTDVDRERFILFTALYKQLNNKYNLGFLNIRQYLKQLTPEAFPDIDRLKDALDELDLKDKTFKLLDYLKRLKTIICSDQSYDIREDIYKKRHFTVDIPSMYGSYHEMKFDAMGLTLRLEALVNVLLEELVRTIDLSLVTKATCYQIYDRLMLLNKALHIDGIHSAELEHHLDLLVHSMEIEGFSFTQYLDIYKGLSRAVKNIINDYFNNIHGENLTLIVSQLGPDQILEKYHSADTARDIEKLRHRVYEIFLRDRISMSLGLQQLDLFLGRILNTLYHQSRKLPKEQLRRLLNYDPQKAITSLQQANDLATGIIYLGNKGLNLLRLVNFGFSIPPGFIITTEIFRYRQIIESFGPARENFRDQLQRRIKQIEQATGKRFGNAKNPLLLSVRSGSSISQPGMMETYLDVGMNEEIAQGLAATSGNPWFAWDNYRRFLQCYGMGIGLQRNDFDAIIGNYKKKKGIPLKREFTGNQMKHVALAYKKRIQDEGYPILEDPMSQVYHTIDAVIESWDSSKAKTYRQIMGISDDWGTAITIQAMVFGNLSRQSGSGVVFTHNPRWAGDSLSLWGDFTLSNQGEDVVSGLVNTLPISIKQQEIEMRETDVTLETHFPDLYRSMQQLARTLVDEKGWAPQEMEFTFEGPRADRLFLLQTRDMAIREHRRVVTFDFGPQDQQIYLGHGIGVSGGALSGRLVFTLEEVDHWRKAEPQSALILARGDTVPDDIREINATDGLLTARGGVTSHASVVAHRLGKTCVVGCGDMIFDEQGHEVEFAGTLLQSGDYISIDGREGSVYQGKIDTKEA
jgi:pyruvate,orthophosphate dikinase